MAEGLPLVHKSLCFGSHLVPTNLQTVCDAAGTIKVDMPLVDLSRIGAAQYGFTTYKWLWQQLGMSQSEWNHGAQRRLPFLQEIVSAIMSRRVKRNRQGKFLDANGRIVPSLLEVEVRGRRFNVFNDPRRLRVDLHSDVEGGVEGETMTWFVGELWKDLHSDPPVVEVVPPVEDAAPPVDEAHVPPAEDVASPVSPGPLPLVDAAAEEEEDVLVAVEAPGARSLSALQQAIDATRQQLAALPNVINVTWYKKAGRFRLFKFPRGGLPIYVPVRNYSQILKSMDLPEDERLAQLIDALNAAAESVS